MLGEILYMKSMKDYIRLRTTRSQFVIKHKLSDMEILLSEDRFARVHRSYMIASEQLTAYTKKIVEIGNIRILIGRSYKAALKCRF